MAFEIRSKQKYRPHGAPWTNTKQNYTIMATLMTKHQYRPRTGKHCCCKHEKGVCCAADGTRFRVPPRTFKV